MKNDHDVLRIQEYEHRFGPYREEDYHRPAECPEDRREMVAEIKVSGAAKILAKHLSAYAEGDYPFPFAEELEPLYHKVMAWDPHLPRRQSQPSVTGTRRVAISSSPESRHLRRPLEGHQMTSSRDSSSLGE